MYLNLTGFSVVIQENVGVELVFFNIAIRSLLCLLKFVDFR